MEYKSNSKKSGIYKITNSKNGRIYIGKSKVFRQRRYEHFKSLKAGSHGNKFLQNDFNKCGEEAFVFEIVELVEDYNNFGSLREQCWLDEHYDGQRQCYNFRKTSKAAERSCYSNTPEETSKVISENMKRIWSDSEVRATRNLVNRGKKRTKETCENISKALTGRRLSTEHVEKMRKANLGKKNGPHTEEAKLKMSLNKTDSKAIKVTNKVTGEVVVYHSQAYAAKALGVSVQTISNVISGKTKTGYKIKDYQFSRIKKRVPWNKGRKCTPEEIKAMSERHKKHCAGNPEWIRKQREVRLGRKDSQETIENKRRASKTKKPIVATSTITGKEIRFPSIKNACETLGVHDAHVYEILKGKRKKSKGYSFHRP